MFALTLPFFIFVSFVAILPSLFWLFSYLREDIHPEPRDIILQLFLIGFLLPPFVAVGEIFLRDYSLVLFPGNLDSPLSSAAILLIVAAAFWEEAAKYLAARTIFRHEKEFDELTDTMIYLVIVALGFAASENIIIILSSLQENPTQNIFLLLGLRTIGANLLHTFSSGILGYFLARGIFLGERFSLLKGLAGATVIHALFNWLVLQVSPDQPYYLLLVIIVLLAGLAIVLRDFRNLKQYDQR